MHLARLFAWSAVAVIGVKVADEFASMLQSKHIGDVSVAMRWATDIPNTWGLDAPHSGTTSMTIPVTGYKCIGTPKAWVVRPDDDKKYPLLSFVHGLGTGGDELLKQWYSDIITSIASLGYVVAAMESGEGADAMCAQGHEDQLHTLEWALHNAQLAAYIDESTGTGIFGHSTGGMSTLLAASSERARELGVRMALAIHPHQFKAVQELDISPKVPVAILTGSADHAYNRDVAYEFYGVASVEKLIVEVTDATHADMKREKSYILKWIECKMKGSMHGESCLQSDICHVADDTPVTECKYEH